MRKWTVGLVAIASLWAGPSRAQPPAAAAPVSRIRTSRSDHRSTRRADASTSERRGPQGVGDFCDGTLVSVEPDVVSVQDFVRHQTITVTAGHSYFARAG